MCFFKEHSRIDKILIKDLNFTFESVRRAINPIKGFKKMVRKIIR
ncbi:hypothetical protein MWE_1388 [Helicobacter pylori XZ274]|nr:hypothetical protein MWE_1388 [Helicobacter pylori XZ274]